MLFPARKTVALILSLLFVWLTLPGAAGAQSDQKTPVTKPPFARQLGPFLSAQENLAYSLGVQAYIYGYPLVASAKTMTEMTQQRAPFNQFYYADSLATPAYRDIVTPNSDTLYMSAWLDLSQTPVLLSVPAIHPEGGTERQGKQLAAYSRRRLQSRAARLRSRSVHAEQAALVAGSRRNKAVPGAVDRS
ncbi:DUF1254 domain-containing protein [Brevibacillus sp. HD1.4A]|nr:DUF1254 domain-containing protein [Brevibacillus sp. HD1.4A]NRQ53929.1 DUF1254 domain-containing protein [Brevibacillus sp. HD1.4A]